LMPDFFFQAIDNHNVGKLWAFLHHIMP